MFVCLRVKKDKRERESEKRRQTGRKNRYTDMEAYADAGLYTGSNDGDTPTVTLI
jgi:hypothetical protein